MPAQSSSVDTGQSASVRVRPLSPAKFRIAMWILLGVYVLNFLDRQVINILVEPIKQELGLADWQLGMLTGFAFAVFYAVAGIPIARYAERGNRPYIIGAAITCWSAFTMLCGIAGSFIQLLLFRFGVGIGEAGGVPPAHSLISDYAPRAKRASALAFFHMGLPIGALMGLALGGLVADAYGWRTAFIVAGAPGIIVAILLFAVLPEPRKQLRVGSTRVQPAVDFVGTFKFLLGKRTFIYVLLGATVISFVTYAHQTFIAAFFFRVHGQEMAEVAAGFGLGPGGFLGISLGLITGIAGSLGIWLGGKLADRGSHIDLGAYCTVPVFSLMLFVPVQVLTFMSSDVTLALLGFIPSIFLASMWIGPVQASIQSVAPPHMRATASAILLLAINLIGLGLGPVTLGLLSDFNSSVLAMGPAEGIRWALVIFTLPSLLAAAFFWFARNDVQRDFEG